MNKKSYKTQFTLWDYGEWLKIYLGKGLREWNFRELAKTAIKILNINYSLHEFDKTFYYISEIEKINIKEPDIFVNWKQLIHKINSESNERNKHIFDMTSEEYAKAQIPSLQALEQISLLNIDTFRTFINSMLIELNQKKIPWEYYFASLTEDNKATITNIFNSYKHLSNSYEVAGDKYIKVKCFSTGLTTSPVFFLWDAVISHIFINFLSLGGQQYYGFCEYCGDFFIIQRKGKKRFCKDTCRVMANRKLKK